MKLEEQQSTIDLRQEVTEGLPHTHSRANTNTTKTLERASLEVLLPRVVAGS